MEQLAPHCPLLATSRSQSSWTSWTNIYFVLFWRPAGATNKSSIRCIFSKVSVFMFLLLLLPIVFLVACLANAGAQCFGKHVYRIIWQRNFNCLPLTLRWTPRCYRFSVIVVVVVHYVLCAPKSEVQTKCAEYQRPHYELFHHASICICVCVFTKRTYIYIYS